MPRQARLDASGTLHHVMIRGIERSPIFKDDQDRKDFVSKEKRRGSALDTGQSLRVLSSFIRPWDGTNVVD
jgi:hypothetical protein